jgi:methionine aminotransferase
MVVYSFGKTCHVTGWKMGYVVAPNHLTREFRKVHQFNVFSVNTPVQYAIAEFLIDREEYLGLPQFFEKKRDYFLERTREAPFRPLTCKGTYFQLFDYSEFSSEGDFDFARRLITDFGIASIPVSAFYSSKRDDKILRLCFAKTEETLEKAGKCLSAIC